MRNNYRTIMRTAVFTSLLVVGLAGYAMAQTPDGETPAEETICDPLKSATPGLYGLCVAYCEAHDAHLLSPAGDPDELDVPNRKILENYNKRKKAGDPDMPCVQKSECPCWTAEQLAELRTPDLSQADNNFANACSSGGEHELIECIDFSDDTGPCFWQILTFSLCEVFNPNQASFGGPPTSSQRLTLEEEDGCLALLEARALVDATTDIWSCFLLLTDSHTDLIEERMRELSRRHRTTRN